MPDDTHRAALARAVELVGGEKPLCQRLRVSTSDLARWLAGDAKPPIGVFLRVIDVLIEEERKPRDVRARKRKPTRAKPSN